MRTKANIELAERAGLTQLIRAFDKTRPDEVEPAHKHTASNKSHGTPNVGYTKKFEGSQKRTKKSQMILKPSNLNDIESIFSSTPERGAGMADLFQVRPEMPSYMQHHLASRQPHTQTGGLLHQVPGHKKTGITPRQLPPGVGFQGPYSGLLARSIIS